jgi:hypothetical protein
MIPRPPPRALLEGGLSAEDDWQSGGDPMSKAGANPEPGIHVVDPPEVRSSWSYDYDAAGASAVPPTVSFRLVGSPVTEGGRVTLHGLLENAGGSPVTLTISSGDSYGGHGAAGPFGLFVQPAPGCAQHKPRPAGEPLLPQQVPPPPLVIELPARTAVRVWRSIVLDDFDWVPGVPREIEWSYEFWTGPKPKGRVRLP